jgi:hypothetical protein
MDPATVAITAASLIGSSAAIKTTSEAGKNIRAAISRVEATVRKRFGDDAEVEEAIERLLAKPESSARTAELADLLRDRLGSDPRFADELAELLRGVPEPSAASFVATVVDNAAVGRITNVGSPEQR